jgi:23S rRNA (adenine2503-C2)-methyltransferase
MPLCAEKPAVLDFFELRPENLPQLLRPWQWPGYRAEQVCQWVYGRLVTDPDKMTNLHKMDRRRLAEGMRFETSRLVTRQDASDKTIKVLLAWPDGRQAEAVMIPDADRRTACLSTQVGCPAGCRFCASGMAGLKGNLSAGQIVEQVFVLNRLLEAAGDARGRITHIVLMGMGEPLANYIQVMEAIRILHDRRGFNIGGRKITLSTVGVPKRMRELAGEGLPLNLAISLHAPNEDLRRQLIPWAEHFALDEILDAARYYFEQTGREVTLEYILLAGVNDRPEHARQLAKLCRTLRANVNLIRYNEVAALPFARPETEDVQVFQRILRTAGVNVHIRRSRGRDIDAACGQLRQRQEWVDAETPAGRVPVAREGDPT